VEISGNAPTAKGPVGTFTGEVWVDPITRGLPLSQLNVAAVRFSPGTHSAWHSHDGAKALGGARAGQHPRACSAGT
jgi:quercetin dioxygenase-like cupin family protein